MIGSVLNHQSQSSPQYSLANSQIPASTFVSKMECPMYQLGNEALSFDRRLGDDPSIPTGSWSTTIASSFENEFPRCTAQNHYSSDQEISQRLQTV
ncbi:uncharacterized protein ARMOST_11854 [Armillaria ostoyae]|uniref:Uncharacterized protein n=1 Tax=Armillaria ostoyae TaxID=47428 RepID=A0A284RI99_ARMOS|nr:uncharacterized protein ARMOST_11854 [Armillaria ostoyae]